MFYIPVIGRCSCMQAYLSQNSAEVVAWGHLEAVLGIFQKLLSSRANEAYAFQLLGTIVMNVGIPLGLVVGVGFVVL